MLKCKMTFVLLSILLFTSKASAVTLKESYQAARTRMETLKRADAQITIRENQKNRLRATMLPTIAAVGSYTKLDAPAAGGVNRAFTLTKQYSAGLRLTQPLLRGGSISAFQAAKDSLLLAEFQKDASDLNLYQLIIGAYFDVKEAQTDLKNLQELLKASQERVGEIRERAKIGRSRKGELVEAEAQLHVAEAQNFQGLALKEQAERLFEFYTGIVSPEIPDLNEVPNEALVGADYLTKLRTRADMLALNQEIKVADRQITVAKGGHYPSVDFVSNYYFDRTGILATSEWDAGIMINIPLFQGGGVSAQVKEAVANKMSVELTSLEQAREAERELVIMHRNYSQILEQLKSSKLAYAKSEEAYKLNRKDYQFGLVTNLDVLQSLNSYIQAKRNYNVLLITAHRTFKGLEAMTGVLP